MRQVLLHLSDRCRPRLLRRSGECAAAPAAVLSRQVEGGGEQVEEGGGTEQVQSSRRPRTLYFQLWSWTACFICLSFPAGKRLTKSRLPVRCGASHPRALQRRPLDSKARCFRLPDEPHAPAGMGSPCRGMAETIPPSPALLHLPGRLQMSQVTCPACANQKLVNIYVGRDGSTHCKLNKTRANTENIFISHKKVMNPAEGPSPLKSWTAATFITLETFLEIAACLCICRCCDFFQRTCHQIDQVVFFIWTCFFSICICLIHLQCMELSRPLYSSLPLSLIFILPWLFFVLSRPYFCINSQNLLQRTCGLENANQFHQSDIMEAWVKWSERRGLVLSSVCQLSYLLCGVIDTNQTNCAHGQIAVLTCRTKTHCGRVSQTQNKNSTQETTYLCQQSL